MKSMGWFSLANSNWRAGMVATNNKLIWQSVEPNEEEFHQEFRAVLVLNTHDGDPVIEVERLQDRDYLGVNIWKPIDSDSYLYRKLIEKALISLAVMN
jgi:hypothetical protein